jgi:hypothetical protein
MGDKIEFTDVGELLTYLGVDNAYDRKAGYCGGSSESYLRRSFTRLGLGYMLVAAFQCKECPYNPTVTCAHAMMMSSTRRAHVRST